MSLSERRSQRQVSGMIGQDLKITKQNAGLSPGSIPASRQSIA